MSAALVLALAMILDAVLGEPRWLWSRVPHPAVLMGRLVGQVDRHLNRGSARRARGMLAVIMLAGAAILLGYVLSCFGALVELIVLAILLPIFDLNQLVR